MNIWHSFFLLLVIAFVVAVFGASVAVHVTARPILEDFKTHSLETRSAASAERIAQELAQMERELGYLGRDAAVTGAVLGLGEREAPVRGWLSRFAKVRDVPLIRVYDGGAHMVAEAGESPGMSNFGVREFDLLARRALEETQLPLPRMLYRPAVGGQSFLIVVPVVQERRLEGALVAEFPFDFGAVLARTQFARTVEIIGVTNGGLGEVESEGAEDRIVTAIEGTPFSLAIEPDESALQKMGADLIGSVTSAIVAALALPFVVLSLGGRKAILEPHEALRKSREELWRSERRLVEFGHVVASTHDAIVMLDRAGVASWVNRSFIELTGYTAEEIVGRRPGDLISGPETSRERVAEIRRAIAMGEPLTTELINHRKDGSPFRTDVALTPLVNEDGKTYGFFAVVRDITEQRRREALLIEAKEEVEHQANHDPLTGLPNRRFVDGVLEDRRREAKTLVRIDLDHFKHVNDTLGHAAGDEVLCHVAGILLGSTRSGDVPARIGGDEFVIVLGSGYDTRAAEFLAHRLRDEICREITVSGKRCRIGASFGIASSRDDLLEDKDLLACADAALYIAKDKGRSTVVRYTKDVHARILSARTLAAELERALARREFVPVFQPQFDALTHEVVGMETLMRWDHPERGRLCPDRFLSVAAQMSVLPDIDAQIFDRSVAIVGGLNRDGFNIPKVSFNVTAPRLQDPTLLETYRQADIGDTKVAIELLESVLIEEESNAFFFYLDNLREAGIEIEIDDFGSGHASIIGLDRVRPDAMKIDRRLILPITESETAQNMVVSIIDMARHLGIRVIAEGVETEAHARLLARLGCDTLQGYWFARPLDEAALRDLLSARSEGGRVTG